MFRANRNAKSRILAVMLAAAMLLTMLPALALSALAADVGDYATLVTEAQATTGDGTIVLTADINGSTQLTIGRSLTLDLNGHSLTIDLPTTTGDTSNGIKINSGMTLAIMDGSAGGTGTLTVINRASGGVFTSYGAAINTTDGTLVITSGTVNATGGFNAAGIGGGLYGGCGTININGGTVIANGVAGAGAGIGTGASGLGGTINITAGHVTANGGNSAAGIGGGRQGRVDSITISGGTVSATGGNGFNSNFGGGAGIGSGGGVTSPVQNSGNIMISGSANVTATGGNSDGGGGAGIGTGGTGQNHTQGSLGTITIDTAGMVIASGGTGTGTPARNGAAIGKGGEGTGPGANLPGYHSVAASAGANGIISPSGNVVVPAGDDKTFTFTPDNGYVIDQVLVDGMDDPVAASSGSFTFSNVTADHTIEVTFAADTSLAPTITTTSLPRGTVGSMYEADLVAEGTKPITWKVSAGSLPNGLSLDGANGRILGEPTTPGTFTFTLEATNGILPDATKELSIVIDESTYPADPVADVAGMIGKLPSAGDLGSRNDVDDAIQAIFDAWEAATKGLTVAQREELEDRFPEMAEKLDALIAKVASINHADGKVTAGLSLEYWYWRLDAVAPSSAQENDFLNALGSNWVLLYLYDITLTNLITGGPWPSGGTPLTMKMSGLALQGATNVEIGHKKADGTIEYLSATVSGNAISFKASSFSLYGVISTTAADGGGNGGGLINRPGTGTPVPPGVGGSGGGNMIAPKTGEGMATHAVGALFLASLMGVSAIVAKKRRESF